MATTLWYRQPYSPLNWSTSQQAQLLCKLSAGQSVLTLWFEWGLSGATSTNVDVVRQQTNWCSAGIVTTIGPGTETPPDPVTESGNQDPPAQRWLWWETRFPLVTVWDATNEIAVWKGTEPQHPIHGEGMVLAPTMSEGDTLNVWFTWRSHDDWDDTGLMALWLATVVGVRSP